VNQVEDHRRDEKAQRENDQHRMNRVTQGSYARLHSNLLMSVAPVDTPLPVQQTVDPTHVVGRRYRRPGSGMRPGRGRRRGRPGTWSMSFAASAEEV
jgi:hypothetical protein